MLQDHIPELALKWLREKRRVALATVVKTWGSAPSRVGAQLVVDSNQEFEGSVSGGCIEGAVILDALAAMDDGKCRLMTFGVSDDNTFEVGLACGGEITVLIEPVATGQGLAMSDLKALVEARKSREPVILEVNTQNWERHLLYQRNSDCDSQFRSGNSEMSGVVFRAVHNPPLRLVVIGAVHIAQCLRPIAKLAGYDLFLCDPRESFASAARFPETVVLDDWPDVALAELKLDSRTAVVTLSHDPKIDTPALQTALASDAFYIGSLGSKRTHGKRVDALKALGFSEAQIARIEGPVGLDIGAATPAEIAISIMAEMTERLRRPETRPSNG